MASSICSSPIFSAASRSAIVRAVLRIPWAPRPERRAASILFSKIRATRPSRKHSLSISPLPMCAFSQLSPFFTEPSVLFRVFWISRAPGDFFAESLCGVCRPSCNFFRARGLQIDAKIDPVEQGRGHFFPVLFDHFARAGAYASGRTVVSARAGIHRHQ